MAPTASKRRKRQWDDVRGSRIDDPRRIGAARRWQGSSRAMLQPTTPISTPLCVAVDWSGARTGERKKLWLGVARDGVVSRLENGRTRAELVEELVAMSRAEPRLVVGLDFAFSFPAWFVRESGAQDAVAMWELVAREAEGWLANCDLPFWGRPQKKKPPREPSRDPLRATEGDTLAEGGVRAKSAFQIGGAGAVGTGSLRGMPFLARLRQAGFAIWPFEQARFPLAVEIYPRRLTGRVTKSDRTAREIFLCNHAGDQGATLRDGARSSEDAFDAFVSALVMSRSIAGLASFEPARTRDERIEGRIWQPARDRGASAG